MIEKDTAGFLFERIVAIVDDEQDSRLKMLSLHSVYKALLKSAVADEKQRIVSDYSRFSFICNKFSIPKKLSNRLVKFDTFAKKVSRDSSVYVSNENYLHALQAVSESLSAFSNTAVPNQIAERFVYTSYQDESAFFAGQSQRNNYRLYIKSTVKNESGIAAQVPSYNVLTEWGEEAVLILKDIWTDTSKLLFKDCTVNIIDARLDKEGKIYADKNSIFVIEPDYLFDVTDIAECFNGAGVNYHTYFLKKFKENRTSLAAMTGNIVNSLFDEMVTNPELDYDEFFDRTVKSKPLAIASLLHTGQTELNLLKLSVKNHLNSVRDNIEKLSADNISLEPTFISPVYGLIGRLDALLTYKNDDKMYDVVELKSGSAPKADSRSGDSKSYAIGLWINHVMQTTCYNLLLDSAIEGRKGNSMILYSKAERAPLRNAPNSLKYKQDAVICRNWLYSLERGIRSGVYTLLEALGSSALADSVPSFMRNDVLRFAEIYCFAPQLEKEYFRALVSFVLNEQIIQKTGNGKSKGFSSLWLDTLSEKSENHSVITNLNLILEESDLEKYHLSFTREEPEAVTSLRKGDLCILYSVDETGNADPLRRPLLKGKIKEMNAEKIQISLWNKFKPELDGAVSWVIEPDYIDSQSRQIFSSIFSFLSLKNEKKEVLFGKRTPEFENIRIADYIDLNSTQNEILGRAVSCKDYYLIQGPPGTGKTSFMLRYLIKHIYENSQENILVTAYTNRAVDEICSALKKISPDFEFLRLGGKDSSVHSDKLLSVLAEKINFKEITDLIGKTRVFVSTVSSLLTNPEIFELKKFSTAVIDEAGQILEAQILGIVSKVNRFIMIGDEKQLPAVVCQPINLLKTESEELKSIGMTNLGMSLFERLINLNTENNRDAVGMLRHQGRMHSSIQNLAGNMFYDGQLLTLDKSDWQNSSSIIGRKGCSEFAGTIFENNRVVFINVPPRGYDKINKLEAKLCADSAEYFANLFGSDLDNDKIGVIAPFRAQCSEISKRINKELSEIISVDTVERFQGSEREVIIMSFSANNSYWLNSISNISEASGKMIDRKLNVALTRAKTTLVLFGTASVLEQSAVYSDMLKQIKSNCLYIDDYKEYISFLEI